MLKSQSANRGLEFRAGTNSYVRILSTLNRELLKPSSSVALHRHSNALVDILPPEADSSISMLSDAERPDVTYHDIGGNDIQKQEIREAVELPLSNPGLYAQVRATTHHRLRGSYACVTLRCCRLNALQLCVRLIPSVRKPCAPRAYVTKHKHHALLQSHRVSFPRHPTL